jgi:hypothetical protein
MTAPSERPTWEARHVDRSQHAEEPSTVFRELGKVLVDHLQGGLEHGIKDGRDLGIETRLRSIAKR